MSGLGIHDHACWGFDDETDWQERVAEFLGEGLREGQQAQYVGGAGRDILAGHLAPLGDVEALIASGALVLSSLRESYEGAGFDPRGQIETFGAVARTAAAAGFQGVRVAADVSPLAAGSLDTYARYEVMVDNLIRDNALAGLCGFDRRTLCDGAVERLACLHPVGPDAPFRVYGGDDGWVRLAGEVDFAVAERFDWAVGQVCAAQGDLRVEVLDGSFLDHRALVVLDRRGCEQGTTVTLRTPSPTVGRMAEVLRLPNLVVEVRP